jgi:hypothetical protein
MKPLSILVLSILVFLLVGCSAGQTTQDKVEEDAKAIQTDPNAQPIDGGAQLSPIKKGGQ